MVGSTVWWSSSSHPACDGLVLYLHALPLLNMQTLGHYAFTSPITFQNSLVWVTRRNITLRLSQNLDSIWQSPHLSVYKRLKPEILCVLRSSHNASHKESMGLFFVSKWCSFRDVLGVPVFSTWSNFQGLTFFHAHRDYVAPQQEPIIKVDTNDVRLPGLTRNCLLPWRLQEKCKFCPTPWVGCPTSIPLTSMLSYYSSALLFCSALSHFPPISPWTAFCGYGAIPVAWTSMGVKIHHHMTAVSVVVPLQTVASLIASSPGVSPVSNCHGQTLHIHLYPPTSYSQTKPHFFPCPRLTFPSEPFHQFIRQDTKWIPALGKHPIMKAQQGARLSGHSNAQDPAPASIWQKTKRQLLTWLLQLLWLPGRQSSNGSAAF